jgi:hypothetical protein
VIRACGLTVLVALTLCLVGCVTSNYMPIGEKTYPPRPDDYVIDVYVPVQAPVIVQQSIANAKPANSLPSFAQQIGRIDTTGAPAANWGSMIEDAKKKARSLGGDAVVIGQWGTQLNGVDGYGNAYHGKNISMMVVPFRD